MPGHKLEGRPCSCEAQAELLSCRGRQRTGPTRGECAAEAFPCPGPERPSFIVGTEGPRPIHSWTPQGGWGLLGQWP